jgi:small-conductance mechanosensitive channel
MEYNGKPIRIGDVVDVNGEKRIVTKIERDTFYSNPYTEDVAKIDMETVVIEEPKEEVVEETVERPRRRGRSK